MAGPWTGPKILVFKPELRIDTANASSCRTDPGNGSAKCGNVPKPPQKFSLSFAASSHGNGQVRSKQKFTPAIQADGADTNPISEDTNTTTQLANHGGKQALTTEASKLDL